MNRANNNNQPIKFIWRRGFPSHVCALFAIPFLVLSGLGSYYNASSSIIAQLIEDKVDFIALGVRPPARSASQRRQDAERVTKRAEIAAAASRSRYRLNTRRNWRNVSARGVVSDMKPLVQPSIQDSALFNYSQPTVPNPLTLPNPYLYLNDTVIILVLSARENFGRRTAIRETWGKDHPVYFVIGGAKLEELGLSNVANNKTIDSNNVTSNRNHSSSVKAMVIKKSGLQIQLEKEQAKFHDLLDSIHPDSYASLTHKIRFGYRWVLEQNPQVEWLVKADDDTVVRVDTLAQAFLHNFNPFIPMVIGRIVERSPVARTGKWADHLYPHHFYPFWPQGSCGHVVSRVVADYVAYTDGLVYYQGEDVSIGIWLDESDLHTTWIHSEYFRNDRKCLTHAWLIMGHEVTSQEMRECYSHADEWPMEDIKHKDRRYWRVENLFQRRGGKW